MGNEAVSLTGIKNRTSTDRHGQTRTGTDRHGQTRTIEAAQVIAELIELAKQMREGQKRGQKLGLTRNLKNLDWWGWGERDGLEDFGCYWGTKLLVSRVSKIGRARAGTDTNI